MGLLTPWADPLPVPEAIERLAKKTPDGILALIQDMGIDGMARHPCLCPVAKLLVAMTKDNTIRVFPTRIRWGHEPDFRWVDHPSSIHRVVGLIDRDMV